MNRRISATLQLTALLSIAIISDIDSVNGRPTDTESDSSKALDKTYYLTRAWGESAMPFSISYSEYGRTQHELLKQSTHQPLTASSSNGMNTPLRRTRKSRNRTRSANAPSTNAPPPHTTTKYFSMPLIFTSNGWGPMG